MYEKVQKKPIRLEFSSTEEENQVLRKFSLSNSIYTPPSKMEDEEGKSERTELVESVVEEKELDKEK